MTLRGSLVFALFGFGCVVVGALVPWIEVGSASEAGIKGRGLAPLILACVGAILLLFGARGERHVAVLCAVCIFGLVIWAQQDVRRKVHEINAFNEYNARTPYSQRLGRINPDDVMGDGPKVAGLGAILAGLSSAWLAMHPDRPTRRFCPYCAESIRVEAVLCPHCQHDVTVYCSECGEECLSDATQCPACGIDFEGECGITEYRWIKSPLLYR